VPTTDPVVEVGRDERMEDDMFGKSDNTTDPVCGTSVDSASAAASIERDGRTFSFCSKHCAEAFNADPLTYASAAVS
jgi:Cu+-exporting ATPase